MLQRTIKFEQIPKFLDATDALAVAVCYAYQKDIDISEPSVKTKKTKSSSSWTSFLSSNPNRVIK
jgi:crossover junction endodeoxyribonuclease RuvC